MILFTYGSLKRGHPNSLILAKSKFVCLTRTRPIYRLYDHGHFPCMVRDEKNGTEVSGELHDVSEKILKYLDSMEGVPVLYRREKIETAEGTQAEAYLWQLPVAGLGVLEDSWNKCY